jgi:hypothetical protein
MVTTSGFPKSGTHALEKAVQLLGQPCTVEHIAYHDPANYNNPVQDKHVFIKRDPRNIICSWLRFNGMPVTPGMFLSAWRHFQSDALDVEMKPYEGWLAHAKTHVVSYEDLMASDVCMLGIADYLGVPYIDGAFDGMEGLTMTWFPVHSDYRTIWTQQVQDAWDREGGSELLTRWGYGG